jgi:hypothetical protein
MVNFTSRAWWAGRAAVVTMAATAGFIGALGAPAVAAAQGPITGPDINGQCSLQYPAGGGYQQGSAYIAPPGDAYSWRCRQSADTPGGATITDLAVDLGAFCASHGAGRPSAANVAEPASWSCT